MAIENVYNNEVTIPQPGEVGYSELLARIGIRALALVPSAENPVSWRGQAECIGVNPVLFYPERGESYKEAKAVCMVCVVRGECLEEALAAEEVFGIWGGTSERQRRIMRRGLRQLAASNRVPTNTPGDNDATDYTDNVVDI